MNELQGLHAFCHLQHSHQAENRFGRMFQLPPLFTAADDLKKIGALGGPMDGGVNANRTATVPVGFVFFGQLVDHDITLDVVSSLDQSANLSNTSNARTPTLDLDCIYGSGPEPHPYLYHGNGIYKGIKLLTGEDGTASSQSAQLAMNDLCRSAGETAIIGDPRNDENRIVSQIQLGVIRFHNKVVDHLSVGLKGKELFEEARKLVTWHYQWVVIHDYLVAICGKAPVSRILGQGRDFYCSENQQPFIPVEFSAAAYRFGHSMVPQKIQVQKNDTAFELFGSVLGRGFTPLSDERAVVDWHELLNTSENRQVQMAEKLDTKMASDLLNLPFIDPDAVPSLASRNLLRGQTFRLPSGEAVAEAMGRNASEIASISVAAQTSVGDNIDLSNGTPLWFYLLTEAETIGRETTPGSFDKGEGLGPVGAKIIAETLIGLVELDERSFLAQNRNWTPTEGVAVSTLGELLTY